MQSMNSNQTEEDPHTPGTALTDEVGDEGGGDGDVELDRSSVTTGSEATSTVSSSATNIEERHRDETGEGRRSP
jgi:hypothetical protein